MKCVICGIPIRSIDDAIEENWLPSFFEGEEEHGPVCYGCSDKLMKMGSDGEYEIKSEYEGKIIYQDEYMEDNLQEEMVFEFLLN